MDKFHRKVVPFPYDSTKKGGGGPTMSDLEERVKHLEGDVTAIKQDVTVIKSNYATKTDILELRVEMHQLFNKSMIVSATIMTTGVATLFFLLQKFPPIAG